MPQKVNFHSATKTENGMIVVLVATGLPDSAVALSLQDGMTEEMMVTRINHAFRTLENGIAPDKRDVA